MTKPDATPRTERLSQVISEAQMERIIKRLLMYGDNKIETVVALRVQRQALDEQAMTIASLRRATGHQPQDDRREE